MKHLSFLFCLFALLLIGCPGEALVGDACEGHDDCGEGLSCVEGVCADKGASDGNSDGTTTVDAGSSDGASDGAATDAGSSHGAVTVDAGAGDGSEIFFCIANCCFNADPSAGIEDLRPAAGYEDCIINCGENGENVSPQENFCTCDDGYMWNYPFTRDYPHDEPFCVRVCPIGSEWMYGVYCWCNGIPFVGPNYPDYVCEATDAGSSDGTAVTDAGSSDGSTDGAAAVDAGSDEEMTMADAGGAAAPVADGGTAEPAAEVLCNNAQDDDEDGQVDCGDPDCAADPACTEVGQCTNAMDDDADGFIDCADSDCAADPACATEECANGMDDDEDGQVDCVDPDCDADLACLEDVSTDAGPGASLGVDAGEAVANCSSTDVLALVMGGDAVNDTIEGCYTTCMVDLSTPTCVSNCVETGTDLSATCSGCFGELGVCMNAHCLVECGMDPGSDTCETCLEANCSDGFADCAGIDLP